MILSARVAIEPNGPRAETSNVRAPTDPDASRAVAEICAFENDRTGSGVSAYMRRHTKTINDGAELLLVQASR